MKKWLDEINEEVEKYNNIGRFHLKLESFIYTTLIDREYLNALLKLTNTEDEKEEINNFFNDKGNNYNYYENPFPKDCFVIEKNNVSENIESIHIHIYASPTNVKFINVNFELFPSRKYQKSFLKILNGNFTPEIFDKRTASEKVLNYRQISEKELEDLYEKIRLEFHSCKYLNNKFIFYEGNESRLLVNCLVENLPYHIFNDTEDDFNEEYFDFLWSLGINPCVKKTEIFNNGVVLMFSSSNDFEYIFSEREFLIMNNKNLVEHSLFDSFIPYINLTNSKIEELISKNAFSVKTYQVKKVLKQSYTYRSFMKRYTHYRHKQWADPRLYFKKLLDNSDSVKRFDDNIHSLECLYKDKLKSNTVSLTFLTLICCIATLLVGIL